jgi:hypothetical protein
VRTTVTLDADVEILIKNRIRKTGAPMKDVVNEALRRGLRQPDPQGRPFVVTPRPLGLPPGLTYDNVAELLEAIEGPSKP